MRRIHHVYIDDWAAIYLDGDLIGETHSFEIGTLLFHLRSNGCDLGNFQGDLKITSKYLDGDWAERVQDEGGFPRKIAGSWIEDRLK